jgi:hypothetical protein
MEREGKAAGGEGGSRSLVLCIYVVVLWALLATFSHLACKKVKTNWGFGL